MKSTQDGLSVERLEPVFSVCKVADYSGVDPERPFCFTGRTDTEKSLVCPVEDVPANTVARDDGWRAFRVRGPLDFSLIGILAARRISIFALSTYDTDTVLTRADRFEEALSALRGAGYRIIDKE